MSERSRDVGPNGDDDDTIVDKLEEAASLLVLGAGLVALFLGYSWFWMVFAVGFAVVVPLVHVLGDVLVDADGTGGSTAERAATDEDSLEALKRRYARGEIDEREFERRLEVLVDADSPDDVAVRLERLRDGSASDPGASHGPPERGGERVEDRELER